MTTTAYRTCHLCEATCGLELHLDGSEITLVRGDRDDVFSGGYLCPKGTAVKHLDTDPDRLHTPMIRRGEDGMRRPGTKRSRSSPSDSARSATRTAMTQSRRTSGTRARTTSRPCSTRAW